MRELLKAELARAAEHIGAALQGDRAPEQRLTDVVMAQRALARALEEADLEATLADRLPGRQ